MKKKEIGEKDIIRCLSNYENLLRDVRERIQYLYTSVATTNDVLESLQMHSGASGTFSGKKEKDLSDVWETYQENEKQYAVFLNSYITGLVEEEEELKRIWTCFQCLPHIQRFVLKALYVEHKAWKMAKAELRMSHTTFSNYRTAAIKNIQNLYRSPMSDLQLLKCSRADMAKKVNLGENLKRKTSQMSLWDLENKGDTHV